MSNFKQLVKQYVAEALEEILQEKAKIAKQWTDDKGTVHTEYEPQEPTRKQRISRGGNKQYGRSKGGVMGSKETTKTRPAK